MTAIEWSSSHATHHLYAIYAMGADRKLLNEAYQTHVVYQRPAFESPGSIDDGNWKDHLGDERYVTSTQILIQYSILTFPSIDITRPT